MIGMLGERYGWAKVGFDKHLDASFQRAIEAGHAWVEHYTDRRYLSHLPDLPAHRQH